MSNPTPFTPSIRIYGTSAAQQEGYNMDAAKHSSHSSIPSPLSPAVPMPIRNNASRGAVPPPLPPPRIIEELNKGQDPGWQWANGKIRRDSDHREDTRYGSAIKPGSSLLGESKFGSRFSDMSNNRRGTTDDGANRPQLARYVFGVLYTLWWGRKPCCTAS
jgi:hypothetical protein